MHADMLTRFFTVSTSRRCGVLVAKRGWSSTNRASPVACSGTHKQGFAWPLHSDPTRLHSRLVLLWNALSGCKTSSYQRVKGARARIHSRTVHSVLGTISNDDTSAAMLRVLYFGYGRTIQSLSFCFPHCSRQTAPAVCIPAALIAAQNDESGNGCESFGRGAF